jgi:hypothetical protein
MSAVPPQAPAKSSIDKSVDQPRKMTWQRTRGNRSSREYLNYNKHLLQHHKSKSVRHTNPVDPVYTIPWPQHSRSAPRDGQRTIQIGKVVDKKKSLATRRVQTHVSLVTSDIKGAKSAPTHLKTSRLVNPVNPHYTSVKFDPAETFVGIMDRLKVAYQQQQQVLEVKARTRHEQMQKRRAEAQPKSYRRTRFDMSTTSPSYGKPPLPPKAPSSSSPPSAAAAVKVLPSRPQSAVPTHSSSRSQPPPSPHHLSSTVTAAVAAGPASAPPTRPVTRPASAPAARHATRRRRDIINHSIVPVWDPALYNKNRASGPVLPSEEHQREIFPTDPAPEPPVHLTHSLDVVPATVRPFVRWRAPDPSSLMDGRYHPLHSVHAAKQEAIKQQQEDEALRLDTANIPDEVDDGPVVTSAFVAYDHFPFQQHLQDPATGYVLKTFTRPLYPHERQARKKEKEKDLAARRGQSKSLPATRPQSARAPSTRVKPTRPHSAAVHGSAARKGGVRPQSARPSSALGLSRAERNTAKYWVARGKSATTAFRELQLRKARELNQRDKDIAMVSSLPNWY